MTLRYVRTSHFSMDVLDGIFTGELGGAWGVLGLSLLVSPRGSEPGGDINAAGAYLASVHFEFETDDLS